MTIFDYPEIEGITIMDSHIDDIDPQLLWMTIDQLKVFLKYSSGFAKFVKERGLIMDNEYIDGYGVTRTEMNFRDTRIIVNTHLFEDRERLLEIMAELTEKSLVMPYDTDYSLKYLGLHEGAHAFQSYLFYLESIKDNLRWDKEYRVVQKRVKNTESKTEKAQLFDEYTRSLAQAIKTDIIGITLDLCPFLDVSEQMSVTGMKNERDFFAECLANALAGKPNILGRAVLLYLKNKGEEIWSKKIKI